MALGSGNFAELLWPGIADLMGQSYSDWESLYTKVFEVRDSEKAFEKIQGVTGLGLAAVKRQGAAIPYSDPLQGFQEEFVPVTYARGTAVTKEMWEDDQYDYINTLPKMLSRSMRHTEESIAWDHFNNGFSASFTGADGVALFSGSHVNVGGGTYSNQLTVAADLSQTSLEQAVTDIMAHTDDLGLQIMVQPKILIVPNELNFVSRRLLETDFVIGSADNDRNGLKGLFKDLVVSPWLTDADAWFIKTDVPLGMMFFWRRKPEPERDNEYETHNLKFSISARFSSGLADPRAMFGTAGA